MKWLLVLALCIAGACKKKEEKKPEEAATSSATSTSAVSSAMSTASSVVSEATTVIPDIPETDKPAVDMLAVFGAGLGMVQNADSAEKAASGLTALMTKHDVAKLRERAKAAKGTPNAATDEQKAEMKKHYASYNEAAKKWAQDPAFQKAHTAWTSAWGIGATGEK